MKPEVENHWRSWCEIELSALEHNIKAVRNLVGPECAIMPMAKADAYGHGMVECSTVFERAGADMMGCANVIEGVALRKAGIQLPILLLSGVLPDELKTILENDLTVTISSEREIAQVNRVAEILELTAEVHLKVDTGMARLGCERREAVHLMKKIMGSSHLALKGFYSHYACADEDVKFSLEQWKVFEAIPSPPGVLRHMCNSAGMLTLKATHADMVRPGLVLFGAPCLKGFKDLLRPALSWFARVVRVREVAKGTTISYGATFATKRTTKIATLSVGYGDGYFRSLSNRGQVLIAGQFCPILGRVTMDQIVVDVTHVHSVKVGDTVTLLGRDGEREISATEMADWAETIPYEIWCHITDRVIKCHRD
ncbi:MAG: alanine racemase [Verrucomicrobiota bacterium]